MIKAIATPIPLLADQTAYLYTAEEFQAPPLDQGRYHRYSQAHLGFPRDLTLYPPALISSISSYEKVNTNKIRPLATQL